jgi:chaperonin GroES
MNLTPLYDNILVRPDEVQKTTESGLIIATDSVQRPTEGTVVAVGAGRILPGGQRLEPAVRPGDRVLFGQFSGQTIKEDVGAGLMVMKEDDILAVVG